MVICWAGGTHGGCGVLGVGLGLSGVPLGYLELTTQLGVWSNQLEKAGDSSGAAEHL